MEEILIDCSPGVSGDMLLGAFHDLGVPKDVIEKTVPTMDIDGFVQATCYGKINSDIMAAAKKVIKLRHVGLEKVNLIKTASAQTVLLEAKTKKPKTD